VTARRAPAGLFAAAVLLAPVLWLLPALVSRQAPSFRDQSDFFHPMKLYTADRIRAGEIPLWNPLSGCGEPWLANLQSGVFYPPGAFFLIPSAALGAGLFLIFHFAVAIAGMWRFLREEGTSPAAAAAGAALFAASGFAASLSAYWNHFGAFAWVPAAAALARSGLDRRSQRLGLAAMLGLQAMAGSPEITGGTLLLAAILVWQRRGPSASSSEFTGGFVSGFAPTAPRRAARIGAVALLGLCLAAWALVPFGELAATSDRREALAAGERDSGAVTWSGAASAAGLDQFGSGTSYLASLAFGPIALAAAAAAFRERERRRLALLLAALGGVGIVLASAGPVGSLLRTLPPFDHIRYPGKYLAATAFALAALAGLGFDALRFDSQARRPLFLGAVACAGALLLLFSGAPPAVRVCGAFGLAALLLGAAAPASKTALVGFLHGAAALILVAGLALAGRPLFRFAPEAEIRLRPATVAKLASVSGRVLTPPMSHLVSRVLIEGEYGAPTLRRQRETLIGYTNLLQGVRTVRTASPLATDASRRIAASIDNGPNLQRTAGTVSARVLWTPDLPPNMGSAKVGDFFRAPVNPYRPRLSFVRGYSVEPDPERAWQRRVAFETDWEKSVFLDREPAPRPIEGAPGRGFVLARIAEERGERIVADVHSDGAGILVLTDLAYPGWRAEADGHPVPILRADGLFRAVALPAGPHQVIFTYRPISFYVGAGVSVAALLVLILLARAGEPRRPEALL
jgi:hypothetical protein